MGQPITYFNIHQPHRPTTFHKRFDFSLLDMDTDQNTSDGADAARCMDGNGIGEPQGETVRRMRGLESGKVWLTSPYANTLQCARHADGHLLRSAHFPSGEATQEVLDKGLVRPGDGTTHGHTADV